MSAPLDVIIPKRELARAIETGVTIGLTCYSIEDWADGINVGYECRFRLAGPMGNHERDWNEQERLEFIRRFND